MKKSIWVLLAAVTIGMLLTGCQKNKNYAVSVEMKDQEEERRDENGRLILSVTGNYPVVSVKGNEAAQTKINGYIDALLAEEAKQADTDEALAKEDLASRDEEMLEFFNGYGLGSEFTAARADSQVVSFRQDVYEFTGGAHPNSGAVGYNFSTETGGLLTLKDVVSDEEAARAFIEQTLAEQLRDPKYADMLFEDYENYIGDILSDTTWYFAEDGFHVISNEYILGPHSSGIMDFVIPYDSFELLNDEYSLRTTQK
ncbi:MAG: DUF3298 and DUF4163 domain-containing protein [Lachnospiraceae bacterium]